MILFVFIATITQIVLDLGYNEVVAHKVEDFYNELNLNPIEEESIIVWLEDLAEKIQARIAVQRMLADTGGYFELDQVLKYKQGNCLGLSQLLYIFARDGGIRVGGIVGKNHIANLVFIDNLVVIVDLAVHPGAYISEPFVTEDVFAPLGNNYYRLHKENFFPTAEMRRIYGEVLMLKPEEMIGVVYFNRGLVASHRDHFDSALVFFKKAKKYIPNFANIYANTGNIYLMIGDDEKALEEFNTAIKLKAGITTAHTNRATILLRKDQLEDALIDCNIALKIDPEFVEAYITRGNIHLRRKEYQMAIADFTQALRIEPDRFEAFLNRGIALMKTGDYGKALKDITQALVIKEDLFEGYLYRGEVYLLLKDYRNAIREYDQALKVNQNSWLGHFNRGNAYFRIENYQASLADFTEAIRLKPDLGLAYLNRAVVYYNLREMAKARMDFEEAFKLDRSHFNDFYESVKSQRRGYLFKMLDSIISGSGDNNARNGSQP